jgi:hypothetical protein
MMLPNEWYGEMWAIMRSGRVFRPTENPPVLYPTQEEADSRSGFKAYHQFVVPVVVTVRPMKVKQLTRQQVLNRLYKHHLLYEAEGVGWYFDQQHRVSSIDANWLLQNKFVVLHHQKDLWPIIGKYYRSHTCPKKESENEAKTKA